MNDDLLKKIFESVIVYENEAISTSHRIDDKVRSRIKPYVCQMGEEERERFENMCNDISYFSKLGGFCLGVKYAVKILAEILKE